MLRSVSRRVLTRFLQCETFSLFDGDRLNAFEDHRKLGRADQRDLFAFAGDRYGNVKSSRFKSFGPVVALVALKGVTVVVWCHQRNNT